MATLTSTDIEALFEGTCQAWNRGDPEAVAAQFAADGRLFTPFGDEHDGLDEVRQAYRYYFSTLLAGSQTRIVLGQVRHLGGDLVIVDATQSISGPIGDLHLTAIVRQSGDTAQLVEVRPYAFLPKP